MAFIVKGTTFFANEEDEEWDIVTYFSESDAKQHAEYANQWAKANNIHSTNMDVAKMEYFQTGGEKNPWELPEVGTSNYGEGVSYFYVPVSIRKKLRPMI